jgi:hypothetical protein
VVVAAPTSEVMLAGRGAGRHYTSLNAPTSEVMLAGRGAGRHYTSLNAPTSEVMLAGRGAGRHYTSLNAPTSEVMLALASPKSMRVFSRVNRPLSTPEKPGFIERFSTNTVRARSTSMMGIP